MSLNLYFSEYPVLATFTTLARTTLPAFIIIKSQKKYVAYVFFLLESANSLYWLSKLNCDELGLNVDNAVMPSSAVLFASLLSVSLGSALFMYAIYTKNYILLGWMFVPNLLASLKWLACFMESFVAGVSKVQDL